MFVKISLRDGLIFLQILLEWLCLQSSSCYHYLTFFSESVSPHSLQLSWYKGYFSTARVSQVNLNTLKKIFERWSELQFAKCLMTHVLYSSCNISSFELWNQMKTTKHWGLRVVNHIVLNLVCVYHEGVYAYNVVSKFWFVKSFSYQHYSKFISNITFENVSQIPTKEWKIRFFICKVNLNFCVLRNTLIVIQFSLWLCRSWMTVFMASTVSLIER